MTGFSVLAVTHAILKPTELYGGLSESFSLLHHGLLASAPAYAVIAVGLFVRTLQAGKSDLP